MNRLWGYLRRYRGRYVLGALCLLLTASLAMAIPYLLKRAIDGIERGLPFSHAATIAAWIAAIAVAQAAVRTLSRALIFNVGRDVERDLRSDLFAHLLRLPLSYYQRQQTGDLMSRLINDVTAIRMLLGVGFLNLLNTPIYYLYGVSIMLTLDPLLTLAALAPFPLLLLAVKRVSRRLLEQTLRVQEGLANLSSVVQENIAGIGVVKAYQGEELAVRRFAAANDSFTQQGLELARVRGRLVPLMKIASGVGTLVVLCYGGLKVIAGSMGVGDLVAFIGYLNLLAWPTLAMGWMLSIVQRGRAAMQRLDHIFSVLPAIRDSETADGTSTEVRGRIEFRDVSFAYGGKVNGDADLRGVSFVVEAGQKLGIVGRTGAGKSTLVNLLPRLFDVSTGAILIDGRDVRDIPLAHLRRSLALVPQDPFLFSIRIADNIAFGLDHPETARIRRAAEIAGVAADIEQFPAGYDTVVGERGITLSGGQKQRLTLARALACEPAVLILDDSLSSVDTRTERHILEDLRTVRHDLTSVVIAHRLSTVMDADHIIVLDSGRITESGTHASLLREGGLYAELFQQQQLEAELEEL